jgi:hypothetical protein
VEMSGSILLNMIGLLVMLTMLRGLGSFVLVGVSDLLDGNELSVARTNREIVSIRAPVA